MELKYKGEIREAIYETAKSLKNIYGLREMYSVCDLIMRFWERCSELPEMEKNKFLAIRTILGLETEKGCEHALMWVKSVEANENKLTRR